jgi:hypothetical protein
MQLLELAEKSQTSSPISSSLSSPTSSGSPTNSSISSPTTTPTTSSTPNSSSSPTTTPTSSSSPTNISSPTTTTGSPTEEQKQLALEMKSLMCCQRSLSSSSAATNSNITLPPTRLRTQQILQRRKKEEKLPSHTKRVEDETAKFFENLENIITDLEETLKKITEDKSSDQLPIKAKIIPIITAVARCCDWIRMRQDRISRYEQQGADNEEKEILEEVFGDYKKELQSFCHNLEEFLPALMGPILAAPLNNDKDGKLLFKASFKCAGVINALERNLQNYQDSIKCAGVINALERNLQNYQDSISAPTANLHRLCTTLITVARDININAYTQLATQAKTEYFGTEKEIEAKDFTDQISVLAQKLDKFKNSKKLRPAIEKLVRAGEEVTRPSSHAQRQRGNEDCKKIISFAFRTMGAETPANNLLDMMSTLFALTPAPTQTFANNRHQLYTHPIFCSSGTSLGKETTATSSQKKRKGHENREELLRDSLLEPQQEKRAKDSPSSDREERKIEPNTNTEQPRTVVVSNPG